MTQQSVLNAVPSAALPKLASIASMPLSGGEVRVPRGSAVERADCWLVEGVWGTPFDRGEFHTSEVFVGSGLGVEDHPTSRGLEFLWTPDCGRMTHRSSVQLSRSNPRSKEIGGTGRGSARRKMESVLRLLKGEDRDALSCELRVTAATLSEWREVFLARGIVGLKIREVDGRDEKTAALEKALAVTALDLSISRAINTVYERKAGASAPGKSTS